MEKKKNSKRNKIIIGVGVTALTVLGSIILYKKCPKVKEVVNQGISKVCSKKKPAELPDFKLKPRTYKTYNGKNI
jgi:hypothetical protein